MGRMDGPRENRGSFHKSLDQIFETLETKNPSCMEELFSDVDSPYYDLDTVLTGMMGGARPGPCEGLEGLAPATPGPSASCKSDLDPGGDLSRIPERSQPPLTHGHVSTGSHGGCACRQRPSLAALSADSEKSQNSPLPVGSAAPGPSHLLPPCGGPGRGCSGRLLSLGQFSCPHSPGTFVPLCVPHCRGRQATAASTSFTFR
uniref:Uncharacterized protein n=1 Tax=Macaca nemestrina TaxID=9545 RepID=A0A2K6DGM7_MACNE